ncbi:MAG TPA: pyridoxal phosphate-dependent aminotransferase [Thermoanaerobaculia bacterium]|nr:pyridoxal phosphate-dependent aminotransferase [Thermoanaerobaculia bacterium]
MAAASPLRWSGRLPWEEPINSLTRAREERASQSLPTIDLTESNPTRVGIPYPDGELREILGRAAGPVYEPHPRGLPEAREALAAALSSPGDPVSPDDLVLTASTSESYSWLFKIFCEPGEEVLTTAPSYPLLDSLAALEGLALSHVHLAPGRGFAIETEKVELALTPDTRLLALIHPGNPTGAFLSPSEQEAMAGLCASRGMPLVSDEVFLDYPLEEACFRPAAGLDGDALVFSLGGLSKSAGLPGWKLGWIRVGGPAGERRRAIEALEMVADSYLSVATPVQRALPEILEVAPRIRCAILDRIRTNLAVLRSSGVELLEPQGGWSAVVRACDPRPDEELALEILDRAGVLVHPGYFFDFATDDFLVLSLLPEPERFAEGVTQLLETLR